MLFVNKVNNGMRGPLEFIHRVVSSQKLSAMNVTSCTSKTYMPW